MSKIRILLIEDNRLLRDGIVTLINAQKDMKIVGVAEGNDDTIQKARTLQPQVMLIDLGVRNQNGASTVKSVTRDCPQVKVIGTGLIPTQSDIVEFVQAGASGFIMKDAEVDDFFETIRSIARGRKVLPPTLSGPLFSHVIELGIRDRKSAPPSAVRITKREREIVSLIADGLTNKEIAQRLDIATYTAKSHVHNILEKLALHSRLQISAFVHNE